MADNLTLNLITLLFHQIGVFSFTCLAFAPINISVSVYSNERRSNFVLFLLEASIVCNTCGLNNCMGSFIIYTVIIFSTKITYIFSLHKLFEKSVLPLPHAPYLFTSPPLTQRTILCFNIPTLMCLLWKFYPLLICLFNFSARRLFYIEPCSWTNIVSDIEVIVFLTHEYWPYTRLGLVQCKDMLLLFSW